MFLIRLFFFWFVIIFLSFLIKIFIIFNFIFQIKYMIFFYNNNNSNNDNDNDSNYIISSNYYYLWWNYFFSNDFLVILTHFSFFIFPFVFSFGVWPKLIFSYLSNTCHSRSVEKQINAYDWFIKLGANVIEN